MLLGCFHKLNLSTAAIFKHQIVRILVAEVGGHKSLSRAQRPEPGICPAPPAIRNFPAASVSARDDAAWSVSLDLHPFQRKGDTKFPDQALDFGAV